MFSPVLTAIHSALEVLIAIPTSISFLFIVLAVLFVILSFIKRADY